MIILYFKLVLAVLVILFIGLEALALISRGSVRFGLLERLSISYALGSGILTSFILMLYVFNIPTSIGFLIPVISVLLIIGVLIITKISGPMDFKGVFTDSRELLARLRSFNFLESLLLIGIVFKMAFVFAEAMIKPVFSWDAAGNHSIRAKALYLYSNDIIRHFLTDFRLTDTFTNDYPMQRSILEAWFYKCMGTWNDQLSKIMYPLMFMVLLMFFYYVVRRLVPRLHALFFTFLLSTVPLFVYHGTLEYVDLSVTFYFTFAVFAMYLWFRENKVSFALLSAAFAGILPTVKAEGGALCLILYSIFAVSLLFRERDVLRSLRGFLAYFLVSFPLYIFWPIFSRLAHLQTVFEMEGLAPAAVWGRFVAYLQVLNKGLFVDGNWNLAFALLGILLITNLVFNYRALVKRASLFLISVLVLYFVYLAFVFSLTSGFGAMGLSLNRVCLSVLPLVILIAADQFDILTNSLSDRGPAKRSR